MGIQTLSQSRESAFDPYAGTYRDVIDRAVKLSAGYSSSTGSMQFRVVQCLRVGGGDWMLVGGGPAL